jgi:site-specific recombinase XerD
MPDLGPLPEEAIIQAQIRRMHVKPGPPIITIFVRHSPDCKYNGDEFYKRCDCRKHLRWSQSGKQYRRKAGTRSWAEAEDVKRRLEDQLAGRTPVVEVQEQTLAQAIDTFKASKEAQGVGASARYAYDLQLRRLRDYSEGRGLYTAAAALTLDNLLAYRSTWPAIHKSSYARAMVQKYIRHFLKFCYNAGWIAKVPVLSTIKNTQPETEPLTEAEYTKLLKHASGDTRTMIQLMRWSGLAVRDAATLKRSDLIHEKNSFKIVRERTKTGTPLYIPIPPGIGAEILTVANGNPVYVFWDKRNLDSSAAAFSMHWSDRLSKTFTAAGIFAEGHMVSHRLRDTFAVDLLQKGVPLEHVSKLLGHKSVTTTERHYARWVKGRQDLLERVVSATWKK